MSVTKVQLVGNVSTGASFAGIVTATGFVGDGSGLTNLANDSLWSSTATGLGTGIYPNNLIRVGIGTSIPDYNLELGTPGTGTTDLYDNIVTGTTKLQIGRAHV